MRGIMTAGFYVCLSFRAGFEAAEYTPTGPNATLAHVFSVIEHLLTLWLPLSIVAVIALLCLIRLVSLMRCCANGSR